MIALLILVLCFVVLVILGALEAIRNRKNVRRLAIRVNVNGIRGKSTVTRLITSILHEARYPTVGKTTGTAARLIIPALGREESIERKPEGANIKEQMNTIRMAVRNKAKALVCECMAVRPEYQDVYQNQMFMANVTVIVNVLEDHLDVMGPTLGEIALAFSRTIPYHGYLIVTQSPYTEFFAQVAQERDTKIFVADNSKVPAGYLARFEYVLFPDNVALGLAFAEALYINREIALRGMLKAAPDPGALRISRLDENNWRGAVFVNAFAANEPESSLKIWEKIQEMDDLPLANPIVIFNGRPDRVDRTYQFVKDFFPHLHDVTLIGMGQSIRPIRQAMNKGRFPGVLEYLHLENTAPQEIAATLHKIAANRLLLGVGNIHGDAELLIEYLYEQTQEETATNQFIREQGNNAAPIGA